MIGRKRKQRRKKQQEPPRPEHNGAGAMIWSAGKRGETWGGGISDICGVITHRDEIQNAALYKDEGRGPQKAQCHTHDDV
jgi:hypothetical protein